MYMLTDFLSINANSTHVLQDLEVSTELKFCSLWFLIVLLRIIYSSSQLSNLSSLSQSGDPLLMGTLFLGIYHVPRCNYDIHLSSSTLQESQLYPLLGFTVLCTCFANSCWALYLKKSRPVYCMCIHNEKFYSPKRGSLQKPARKTRKPGICLQKWGRKRLS